ncbi:MAG TPA: SDR family oxidoreductase [Mucilaginibacter sp.]|nr:SDR family oxidoreductase [Mucilaginibacter sp.]
MYSDYYLNKIALITGGGSGIGRALCIKLAEAGATVICSDVDPEKADETVSLCRQGQAVAEKLDVAQLAAFESLIAETVNEHGRIDLIFNNAGIAVSGEIRDIPLDQWRKIIDINFMGVLYGSQTAYHYMLKQGSGQIVNIASAAGLIDYLALMAPYSVTKHAVVNYTKLLRIEAKALGIKANVVCPGFISTSIGVNAIAPNAKPSWSDDAIKMVSKGISPEKAVDQILKGVARNKEVIIFPFEVKGILLFTRLFKGLYRKTIQKQIAVFRTKHRVN